MTVEQAQVGHLAAHLASELCQRSTLLPDRGHREGRAPAGARGPRAAKSTRQNHRLSRDHPAFPARVVYGLYALSPGTGFLAPVARKTRQHLRAWPQHREARTTRLRRPCRCCSSARLI